MKWANWNEADETPLGWSRCKEDKLNRSTPIQEEGIGQYIIHANRLSAYLSAAMPLATGVCSHRSRQDCLPCSRLAR